MKKFWFSFNMFSHVISVYLIDNLIDIGSCSGQMFGFPKNEIQLDSSLNDDDLRSVFMHELLHVACDLSGLTVNFLTEAQTEVLSQLLNQALGQYLTLPRRQ